MKPESTLIFVPSDKNQQPSKITFPDKFRIFIPLGAILFTFLISSLLAFNMYQRQYIKQHKPRIVHINEIELQLHDKNMEVNDLKGQLETINSNLDSIASLQSKIFAMLDYDNDTLAALASDKPIPSENTPIPIGNVSSLEEASEQTQSYLTTIETYYDEVLIAHENKLQHMPSILPLQGTITSRFGNRPDPFNPSVIEFHKGVDIGAPHGTPIKASANGIVISAGYETGWGYCINIDHGYSVTTIYAHLSQIDVTPGQEVERGDTIGRVGSTGRSTGNHLHYSIIVDGLAVDPLKFNTITQATQAAQTEQTEHAT